MMSSLPSSGLQGHEIRDAVTSDDTGSHWFDDEDINKWSLWKPIKSSADSLTLGAINANNCGLIIPNANSIQALAARMVNVNWDWLYDRPGINDKKRCGDFRNYNHAATNPSDSHTLSGTFIEGEVSEFTSYFIFGADIGIGNFPNMSVDLGSMSNLLYGLAVLSPTGQGVSRWVTSKDCVTSSSGGRATISLAGLRGTYRMIPFLTSAHKENIYDVPDGGNEYFGLPQQPTTFKVLLVSEIFILTITLPYYHSSSQRGSCECNFFNNYSQSVTISGSARFKYVGNQPTSAIQSGEKLVAIPQATVNVGESYTHAITATRLGSDVYRDMYVYISLNVKYGSNTAYVNKQENLIKTN